MHLPGSSAAWIVLYGRTASALNMKFETNELSARYVVLSRTWKHPPFRSWNYWYRGLFVVVSSSICGTMMRNWLLDLFSSSEEEFIWAWATADLPHICLKFLVSKN